jgi:hypothetical protein
MKNASLIVLLAITMSGLFDKIHLSPKIIYPNIICNYHFRKNSFVHIGNIVRNFRLVCNLLPNESVSFYTPFLSSMPVTRKTGCHKSIIITA